jgi:hypothetical protein
VFTTRYGLPTRRTAVRYVCLEGSDGFVTSAAAPIASGWSDQTWPGGTCTHWDAVPYHGAQYIYLLVLTADRVLSGTRLIRVPSV